MQLSQLDYDFPDSLIARSPQEPCRILFQDDRGCPAEISRSQLFDLLQPGDLLVANDTRVCKRRIFGENGLEILFIRELAALEWEVLFAARERKVGDAILLPGGVKAQLAQKGLPQVVTVNRPLDENYFEIHGEMALPPYIQKARNDRHTSAEDVHWYQTEWAKHSGSTAAPTASLHFSRKDFFELERKGVEVRFLTLHVGLGTFLPMKSENLADHLMHEEKVIIPRATVAAIEQTRVKGRRIWALGTTVARSLESAASGELNADEFGGLSGYAKIFIRPGYEWKLVDGLLTNFHQPRSTLLALVSALSGLEQTKRAYEFAIQNKFRLFSYGDLSVWLRQ